MSFDTENEIYDELGKLIDAVISDEKEVCIYCY